MCLASFESFKFNNDTERINRPGKTDAIDVKPLVLYGRERHDRPARHSPGLGARRRDLVVADQPKINGPLSESDADQFQRRSGLTQRRRREQAHVLLRGENLLRARAGIVD